MTTGNTRRGPLPFAIPAACAALFALQVWIFHWGVATFDTIVQYRQVLSGQYEDWHPPITTFLWRLLGGARLGTAPYLLLDCALYWSGFGLIAEALWRRGRTGFAIAVVVIGALPIPFGQMGAILKDPLLAACCLAATGLLALGGCARGARTAAALLLLVAGATRFNAVFAVAPLLVLCAAPGLWRRPRLATLPALLPALLAPALGAMLVDHVLQPRRTEPIWSLVNYDLAGTSRFAEQSVYPAGADPGLAMIRHCYSPRLFAVTDYTGCDPVEDDLRTFAHRTNASAPQVWLTAIGRAPLGYLAHRLIHFDHNQRWLVATIPDDAIFLKGEANDLGLGVIPPHPAMWAVYRAARLMAWSPLGRPATWLAAALALVLLVPGGRVPPLAAALATSALLYGGAYAVVSVADDLRYNLWTMLAAMLAWLLTLAAVPWRALPRGRRIVAAGLPAVAMLGEVATLAW